VCTPTGGQAWRGWGAGRRANADNGSLASVLPAAGQRKTQKTALSQELPRSRNSGKTDTATLSRFPTAARQRKNRHRHSFEISRIHRDGGKNRNPPSLKNYHTAGIEEKQETALFRDSPHTPQQRKNRNRNSFENSRYERVEQNTDTRADYSGSHHGRTGGHSAASPPRQARCARPQPAKRGGDGVQAAGCGDSRRRGRQRFYRRTCSNV
jgi:hypothetical protein